MKVISKRLGVLILFILIIVCSFSENSYAHEIFYKGTQPVPLRWHNVASRTATLRLNGSYLRSDYQTEYVSARVAWPNASQRIRVLQTDDLAQADVVMATLSEHDWDSAFGNLSRYVLGRADLVSTDNVSIRTLADAERSSRVIRRASIILTPYTTGLNAQQRRTVMIHEIGHVLGLGHPNAAYNPTDAPSIMRVSPLSPLYIQPQSHDKTDLNSFY